MGPWQERERSVVGKDEVFSAAPHVPARFDVGDLVRMNEFNTFWFACILMGKLSARKISKLITPECHSPVVPEV